jgi:hypothetical protein
MINISDYLSLIHLILICIGVIGNGINIAIFAQKEIRKMSTFRLLLYLSIIDLLVLLISATDSLITYKLEFQIRLQSNLACKLHTYLTYFLTHLSSVVLMLVSIERAIVIMNGKRWDRCHVTQQKTVIINKFDSVRIEINYLSLNRIEKFLIMVILFTGLINSHYLIYMNLYRVDSTNSTMDQVMKNTDSLLVNSVSELRKQLFKSANKTDLLSLVLSKNEKENLNSFACYPQDGSFYSYFLNNIWFWIDTMVYSVIPFFVMVICSLCILIKINKSTHRLRNNNRRSNLVLSKRLMHRNNQILVMLFATNFYFIITSLPHCVLFYLYNSEMSHFTQNSLILVNIMSYSNNSIYFIFFILFSQIYRQAFFSLIRCSKYSPIQR